MIDPFELQNIENWASDFCQGDRIRQFSPATQSAADALLTTFLKTACAARGVSPGDIEEPDVRAGMLEIGKRHLPGGACGEIPDLCAAFLTDLEEQGRLSGGRALGAYARALRDAFEHQHKPKPITRPGSKLNRNDPCPCGSGKKYKKCCME